MPQLHTHTYRPSPFFTGDPRHLSLKRESAYVPERSMKATRDPAQISSLLPLLFLHIGRCASLAILSFFSSSSLCSPVLTEYRDSTHTHIMVHTRSKAQSGERPTLSRVVVSPVLSLPRFQLVDPSSSCSPKPSGGAHSRRSASLPLPVIDPGKPHLASPPPLARPKFPLAKPEAALGCCHLCCSERFIHTHLSLTKLGFSSLNCWEPHPNGRQVSVPNGVVLRGTGAGRNLQTKAAKR